MFKKAANKITLIPLSKVVIRSHYRNGVQFLYNYCSVLATLSRIKPKIEKEKTTKNNIKYLLYLDQQRLHKLEFFFITKMFWTFLFTDFKNCISHVIMLSLRLCIMTRFQVTWWGWGWVTSQIEWPWLDSWQIGSGCFCHVKTGSGFTTSDHVPPHIYLRRGGCVWICGCWSAWRK